MNLPYFEPEDTSTKNLTDQLFKQQVIIADLLGALTEIQDVLYGSGILNTRWLKRFVADTIRKAEKNNA